MEGVIAWRKGNSELALLVSIGITLHSPIILETACAFVAVIFANEFDDRSALHDLRKEAWSFLR